MVDTPKERIIARARAMHADTGLADVVDGLPLVLPMLPRRAVLESKVITQLTHVAARARETRKRLRGQGEVGAGVGFGDRAGRPVLHQVTQTMRPFDAVSNDTLAIQNLLRTNGFYSEIFAEHIDPSLRDRVRSVDQLSDPAVDRDAVLVHVCVHAPRLMRILEQRSGPLHLRFHSNTPPAWFAGVSIGFEQSSRKGWAEMTRLSRIARSAIADSAHNVREITEVGMRDVTLVPILLEPADLTRVPAVATGNYAVSVGRIAPNKRIDFALRTIAAYQRTYDPDFGLVLVGSDRGLERYSAACHSLALSLGVRNVRWVGSVTEAEKLRLPTSAPQTTRVSACRSSRASGSACRSWHAPRVRSRTPVVTHLQSTRPIHRCSRMSYALSSLMRGCGINWSPCRAKRQNASILSLSASRCWRGPARTSPGRSRVARADATTARM